jgi:hypothetical protein
MHAHAGDVKCMCFRVLWVIARAWFDRLGDQADRIIAVVLDGLADPDDDVRIAAVQAVAAALIIGVGPCVNDASARLQTIATAIPYDFNQHAIVHCAKGLFQLCTIAYVVSTANLQPAYGCGCLAIAVAIVRTECILAAAIVAPGIELAVGNAQGLDEGAHGHLVEIADLLQKHFIRFWSTKMGDEGQAMRPLLEAVVFLLRRFGIDIFGARFQEFFQAVGDTVREIEFYRVDETVAMAGLLVPISRLFMMVAIISINFEKTVGSRASGL